MYAKQLLDVQDPHTNTRICTHTHIHAVIPPPREAEATHVVCLTNLLTDEELQDPQEADDVLEDTRDKCEEVSEIICMCVCGCVYVWADDVLEDTRDK